jgi:hypothetical protein
MSIVRNGAIDCSDTTSASENAILSYNGTNQYTGSFSYALDTYFVSITNSGMTWNMSISNTAGCGFGSCVYNQSGPSYNGPFADMNATCGGVCGCGSLHIDYTGISIS